MTLFQLTTLLILSVAVFTVFSFPALAQVEALNRGDCKDLGIKCSGRDKASAIVKYIRTIVNVFLTIVSIIAAAFVVWGGVQYIKSMGNESDVETAKRTILYAIIGLVIVGLAKTIVSFTIGATEGRVGDLPQRLWTIVNISLVLTAILAAIFLVIGGVKYISSQGNEEDAASAKRTIIYSVIGLVVIGLSGAIVNFVILATI